MGDIELSKNATNAGALLVLAMGGALCGCGKKAVEPGAGSQSDRASGASAQPGSAAAPVHTAEGGAVAALPAVAECPKSLAGSERVARTISKSCGPVVVTGDYEVNGSLTLEAGAVLKFQDGAGLEIGHYEPAKLIVKGTTQEPVTMTSAGDAAPGAWRGVRLYDKADRSQIAHLVIEHAGGDHGALYVEASDVVLKNSTIRDAKDLGLVVADRGRFAEMTGNTFEKAGKVAISLSAPAVGDLGTNAFDEGAFVQVSGGTVEENAKWRNPGAPYVVVEDIGVAGKTGKATLEIQAGTELRFHNAGLAVGQYSDGVLVVAGTADKPVVFTAAEDKVPGAWKGISVYGHGELRMSGATLSYGGAADRRGVLVLDGGTASVTATTFDGNKRGVDVLGRSTLKSFDQNKLSASPEPALSIVAEQVAALGPGNTFDKAAHIEVTGGAPKGNATWTPQGVPYEVTEEISVADKAVLTLLPGIELAFDASQLVVGQYSEGTLKAVATTDKPIKLRALRDEAPWKGLMFHSHTINSELAHVQLAQTSGDAGVMVERDAAVKLTAVACAKCANAAVTSQCGAKLIASEIKAGAGTPKAELKPDCGK